MAVRRILEELEARLAPPPEAASRDGAKGKLEFKRYGDGSQRMKITCRKLDVPEGAALKLLCGDTVVAVLVARSGRAEIDEERPASEAAPPLAAGDVLTLCHQGIPLLCGQLHPD